MKCYRLLLQLSIVKRTKTETLRADEFGKDSYTTLQVLAEIVRLSSTLDKQGDLGGK